MLRSEGKAWTFCFVSAHNRTQSGKLKIHLKVRRRQQEQQQQVHKTKAHEAYGSL